MWKNLKKKQKTIYHKDRLSKKVKYSCSIYESMHRFSAGMLQNYLRHTLHCTRDLDRKLMLKIFQINVLFNTQYWRQFYSAVTVLKTIFVP